MCKGARHIQCVVPCWVRDEVWVNSKSRPLCVKSGAVCVPWAVLKDGAAVGTKQGTWLNDTCKPTDSCCRGCRKVKWVFPVLERGAQDLSTSHFLTHAAPLQFIAHSGALWGRAAFAELYLGTLNQPTLFKIIEYWEVRMWKHNWRKSLLQSVMLGFSYNFRVTFYAFYITWSMPSMLQVTAHKHEFLSLNWGKLQRVLDI